MQKELKIMAQREWRVALVLCALGTLLYWVDTVLFNRFAALETQAPSGFKQVFTRYDYICIVAKLHLGVIAIFFLYLAYLEYKYVIGLAGARHPDTPQ